MVNFLNIVVDYRGGGQCKKAASHCEFGHLQETVFESGGHGGCGHGIYSSTGRGHHGRQKQPFNLLLHPSHSRQTLQPVLFKILPAAEI